jgi:hypothetical protein
VSDEWWWGDVEAAAAADAAAIAVGTVAATIDAAVVAVADPSAAGASAAPVAATTVCARRVHSAAGLERAEASYMAQPLHLVSFHGVYGWFWNMGLLTRVMCTPAMHTCHAPDCMNLV